MTAKQASEAATTVKRAGTASQKCGSPKKRQSLTRNSAFRRADAAKRQASMPDRLRQSLIPKPGSAVGAGELAADGFERMNSHCNRTSREPSKITLKWVSP